VQALSIFRRDVAVTVNSILLLYIVDTEEHFEIMVPLNTKGINSKGSGKRNAFILRH
jgi:hypothetical protein